MVTLLRSLVYQVLSVNVVTFLLVDQVTEMRVGANAWNDKKLFEMNYRAARVFPEP